MLRVILHIQGFKEIVHMLHENLRTALFQSAHLQAKRHEPTPDIIYREVEVLAAPLIRLIPSSFFTASSREGLVGDTVFIPMPAKCTQCSTACDITKHGRLLICDLCQQAFCEVGARLTWPSMQSGAIFCLECSKNEGKSHAEEAERCRAKLSEVAVAGVSWPLGQNSGLCKSSKKCSACKNRKDLQLLCRHVVPKGLHCTPSSLRREAALYHAAMKIRVSECTTTIGGYCAEVPSNVTLVAHQACDLLSADIVAHLEHRIKHPSALPPYLSVDWTPDTK